MRLLTAAAMLSLVAVATPAFALQSGPTTATPASNTNDRERLICRRESVTGSLAGGRRTCLTAEQWRAQAREASSTGQNMINRGNTSAQRTGG